MERSSLKFCQAIHEALDICLARDPSVYVMGLGVPDPIGVFGTTAGLQEKHGADRVMDMPARENAMTGIAIGSRLVGMRPVMTHMRLDFAILAIDQICQPGGQMALHVRRPVQGCRSSMRMIVGRGWGQGPQHAQSLQSWFAHIPGLKVVMPATPHDAKGLLIAAIEDNNPVIFIEHRWLLQYRWPGAGGALHHETGSNRGRSSGPACHRGSLFLYDDRSAAGRHGIGERGNRAGSDRHQEPESV